MTLYYCTHTDIASVCSKETILCTNTLSLQLSDVFSDVPNPEVCAICGSSTHYPIPMQTPRYLPYYQEWSLGMRLPTTK